ncbi:uncharacterized protein [Amphiura filiformis]|uniref:uncharacterized protein n=1 Tax=Amphiura filiformis TaxID=82378 RepID=UPI003B21643F
MEQCVAILSLIALLSTISFATHFDGSSNDIYDRLDHSIITILVARFDSLEQQMTTLTQRCNELEERNQQLEVLVVKQTQDLSELAEQIDHQEDRSNLLEKALMGVLSKQLHASWNEISIRAFSDVKSSFPQETLEEFLGNRAAELVAYSPYFGDSKTKTAKSTMNSDSVAKALNLITETNHKLTKKIEHLEGYIEAGGEMSAGKHIDLDKQMLQHLLDRVSHIKDVLNSPDDIVTRGDINGESRKSAFSVAATRPQMGRDGAMTPLLLDHVFLNKGGDFNVTNSTFICEIPGYYFFTYTMRTYYGYTLAVNLVKNREYIVALFSDDDERNVMDSQSVMLELVPGDIIYLALGSSKQYGYYSDTHNLSTFSGFLLYKKS